MFENLVGENLDRYQILRKIGEGSQGTVFEAYDATLQRNFAIKVLAPSLTKQPNFAENFAQIARTAARLDHPNLIQVLDFGNVRTYNYIVMEYIPGDNLEQLLNDLKLNSQWIILSEAVQLVRQLALALEFVRSQGAPQRVLKPANVMLKPVRGEKLPYLPLLVDLGLDRLYEGGMAGSPAIAPAYLSPEGALGRSTDARSDVYTLGVLLFELVTGQLPFPIQNLDDAVRYHTRQPLPPPSSIRPNLPASLEGVIIQALEKNAQGRFANPSALAEELDKIAPELADDRTPPPIFESSVSLMEPYQQSLEEGGGRPVAERPAPTEAVKPQAVPQTVPIQLVLDRAQISVDPGSSVSVGFALTNPGDAEKIFRLTLEGIPASWASLSSQVIRIKPGESTRGSFTLHVPRSPKSRAGRYPIKLRVADSQNPGQFAEAKAILTVAAFARFSSELYTRQLNAGETGQIGVNNLGNMPETFTLSFQDPAGRLIFTATPSQFRLSEGQAGVAEFRAALRNLRWVGREEAYPFTTRVNPTDGEAQTHTGEVISKPLLPVWLLGLLLFVLVCFVGTSLLYFSQAGLQSARATGTLVSAQTGTVLAFQSTVEAGTATALYLANANQATLEAVTAEAAASQATAAQLETEQAVTAQAATALVATPQAAATQTAAVLQATDAAAQAFLHATETAQALNFAAATATSAAQTAAAQGAQAGTATAQAAAVQTATAQAAALLTATAQAGAQGTATAQAAATQTAGAPTLLAYIFVTDTVKAQNFQSLLQGNNFRVDLIPQDAIFLTDFSRYRAILIGPDTGSNETWGDGQGNQANKIISSGLPVAGIGEGGYAFFGRAGLAIGYNNGIKASGTDVNVVDPGDTIWTVPYQIQIPDNHILTLYNAPSPLVAITIQPPPPAVMKLIGGQPGDINHYSIIRQQNRYLLWGFSAGPSAMSQTGQQSFVDMVKSLIP
jgi:serine/threonine protein kinase